MEKGFNKKTTNGERIILSGDFVEKISKSKLFMDGEEVDAIILVGKKGEGESRILLSGDMNEMRNHLLAAMLTDNNNPFNEVFNVAKSGMNIKGSDIGDMLKGLLEPDRKECDCPACTLRAKIEKEGWSPEHKEEAINMLKERLDERD